MQDIINGLVVMFIFGIALMERHFIIANAMADVSFIMKTL